MLGGVKDIERHSCRLAELHSLLSYRIAERCAVLFPNSHKECLDLRFFICQSH